MKKFRLLFLLTFLAFLAPLISFAQTDDDDYDYGSDDEYYDEGSDDFYDDEEGGYDDEEEEEEKEPEPPKPVKKPFIRFVPPVDSITGLITYTEVVEQDESYQDSLYYRAKEFGLKNFGDYKGMIEVDNLYEKLLFNGVFDAYTIRNQYSKSYQGRVLFTMVVWFKEGRYKFTLTNFVHEGKSQPDAKREPNYTYFEYYASTNTNVRFVDNLLRTSDGRINDLIDQFKEHMKDPIIVDEDDW